MDYLSDAPPPRHEMYNLKAPPKISSPLENLLDPAAYSSGKYSNVEPSAAPSIVPDRVENGHAPDPCAPAQSAEYQASDSAEKRLISSKSLPVPPTDVCASVEKVDQLDDQEPVETSTATAKASKFEDVLESPVAPEPIGQRDRGENDLLDSGKRDFEELAPTADRGFEPSPRSLPEAVDDQIVPSEGGNAPDQQDQQEVYTEAAEIQPVTKCLVDDAVSTTTSDVTDHAPLGLETQLDRSASSEVFESNEPLEAAHDVEAESTTEIQARSFDPIDHLPEQTVEAANELTPNVAAEDVEAGTSVTEQHEVKDRSESLADATAAEAFAVKGDDGSKCHDQVVDDLHFPKAAPDVDKDEAAVQDPIPVAETAEDSTSCEADDPKKDAHELTEPFDSKSNIESERSYQADDGGKKESAPKENIVDETSCGIDGSTPASDDQIKEEFAEIERSAPAEQNFAETPCERSLYQADDGGKEESAAKENIVDERSSGIDGSAPASDGQMKDEFAAIERSAPAEQHVTETPCESNDDKKKEDDDVIKPSASQTLVEEINYPLSDDAVKEVAVEESPAAEKGNERSYGIDEATPAASDDQPKEEFAEPDQKLAPAEEKASETSDSIESAPATSIDDQTKEDDTVIEPPASRTVEVEKSYQLADESVEDAPAAEKEDARSCKTESNPAATDDPKANEFVEVEKSAPAEENVSETRFNIDESTPVVSDADLKKSEDDEVVEPSTPQILELDRSSHLDEPAKEDAVEEPPALAPAHDTTERNYSIESIPAASDVQRTDVDVAPKLETSPPVEDNFTETSLHNIESTPAATNEDDRTTEIFTEPGKLSTPAAENASDQRSSYGIKSATDPASCDDQRVDPEESKDQKTEFEAPEGEIKSELLIPHSPAPQDDAQTVTDPSSSPASKAGEGIELSHKIPDSGAPAQPPQIGYKDSTTTTTTAVKEKPEFAAVDRETQHNSEDDGASKEEVEHAGSEPHHKASFLGKLIDKVTGKNK